MKIKKLNFSDLIALFIILSLVLSLPLFVWALINQRFELTKSAQAVDYGQIYLEPLTKTSYINDMFPVNIVFHTGQSSPNTISSLSLRITYPYTGTSPELLPVNQTGQAIAAVIPNQELLLTGQWSFPVNQITSDNGLVTIDIAAINTSVAGFYSSQPINLATFYLKSTALTSGPVTLAVDQSQSLMMTKNTPVTNILDPGLPAATYEVTQDSQGPQAISDFEIIELTNNNVSLKWTSPPDQGPEGFSEGSMIVSNSEPITDQNWDSSIVLGGHQSYSTGTIETISFNHTFDPGTHYFAIKTFDKTGNYSAISNVVSGTVNGGVINYGFRLQGVFSQISKNFTKLVTQNNLTIDESNTTHQSTSEGIFESDFTSPVSGNQELFIKADGYLRKIFNFVTSPGSSSNYDWTSDPLLAGDFDGNNKLNISDIGLLLSVYTSLTIPVDSSNQVYDIDANGVINVSDIALVLSNYTQLEVQGD